MSGVTEICVTAITHRGLVRDDNEDCIAVGAWIRSAPMDAPAQFRHSLRVPMLCLVADGMGGHAAGQEASRRAAFHLARSTEETAGEAALADRIRAAHRALFSAMAEVPELAGMGTTVAGLLIGQAGSLYFNVGDSRIYRVRDGFIRQLSVDDVPPGDRGDPLDVRSARSGRLTQCLGGAAEETGIAPHIGSDPLVPGWLYLICSDGLTDLVPVDHVEAVLTAAISDDEKAGALLEGALAGGGTDNISIVLVRLSENSASGT